MTSQPDHSLKPWQQKAWVQVLAILIGVAPIYTMAIVSHLTRDQPMVLKDIVLFTTVFAGIMIVVIFLLLRFLCGERISDLNLKPGKWWKDVVGGVALGVTTLGLHLLVQGPLNRMFPPEPVSGLGDFFNGLAENIWLFVLFIGPILWIGVAGFEELTRIFLLSRLWKIWDADAWRWATVVLSAVMFGLLHVYQGTAGMVDTGITGLLLAVCYLTFGRVWPLIIAHYLHDAAQIVLIVTLIRSGVIQF
jgi:hypothetical protein